MAKYLISFRIGDQGDYDERYGMLVHDLGSVLEGAYWDETTSFYAKISSMRIEDLFDRLMGHLDRRFDTLLILDAERKDGVVGGVLNDQDIFAILPFVQKR